jgi:hypothetical protein
MEPTPPADPEIRERRRISLELSRQRIAHLDRLKREWGLSSRGGVVERLLDDIFESLDDAIEEAIVEAVQPGSDSSGAHTSAPALDQRDPAAGAGERQEDGGDGADLDEHTALVLVPAGDLTGPGSAAWDQEEPFPDRRGQRDGGGGGGGGIDLPGFVRSRSDQIRRSLRSKQPSLTPMPRMSTALAEESEQVARQHWLDLYGTAPSATVLEAAMVWLGRDIWPETDQSDGRTFTWSLANLVMAELIPGWQEQDPSFERVMLVAGVLQDPFSVASLPLRMPTLIRGFVHRFRRRRSATSFQTLEHTMTLQGALKLLQLPTDPGRRLSLAQIREAYRDLAMRHHPDSGGSVETMRRLNEAYQLLKELYRQRA